MKKVKKSRRKSNRKVKKLMKKIKKVTKKSQKVIVTYFEVILPLAKIFDPGGERINVKQTGVIINPLEPKGVRNETYRLNLKLKPQVK